VGLLEELECEDSTPGFGGLLSDEAYDPLEFAARGENGVLADRSAASEH
jgi:hypothetical protein